MRNNALRPIAAVTLIASGFVAAPALANNTAAAAAAPNRLGGIDRLGDFDTGTAEDVFEGDYVIVAVGAGYVSDYDGGDEYSVQYGGAVKGSVGGIGFATKGVGLELDLIPNLPGDIELSLGPEFRYRQTRTGDLKDDVVDLLPKLDKTFEVGIDAGISFKKLFTPMDSLAFGASKRWDVSGNGAGSNHNVSVSYSTALSKGMGAGVSLGASWYDDDYADYYYTITPEGSAATGGQLPTYNAKSGMKDWDARVFYGVDLDGDFRNGGLALAAALSYQRLQGSAAETPIVSMRGDRNQYAALLGVGYAF